MCTDRSDSPILLRWTEQYWSVQFQIEGPFVVAQFIAPCDESHDYKPIYLQFQDGQTTS